MFKERITFAHVAVACYLAALIVMLGLVCSGCGPVTGPAICTSRCGIELVNVPKPLKEGLEPWTCEGLQRVEDETEAAFQRTSDPRLIQFCSGVAGWKVYVREEFSWVQPVSHNDIQGQTYCTGEAGVMEVNNAPPGRGAFPHEVAHALQKCQPMSSKPAWEDFHAGWQDQGILNAIDDVWGEEWDRMVDAGWVP